VDDSLCRLILAVCVVEFSGSLFALQGKPWEMIALCPAVICACWRDIL